MLVTEFEMVTDVRLLQPKNAENPMLVTDLPSNTSGMTMVALYSSLWPET